MLNKSFKVLNIGLCLLISGCSSFHDFNSLPELSPVRSDLGATSAAPQAAGPANPFLANNASLFNGRAVNFYKDPRAMQPGDILTVLISINDRASISNQTNVKKNSKSDYSIGGGYSFMKKLTGSITGSSDNQAQGDGKIQRNEDIRLSVAAIVTKVLPNGNLLINGSQEVRVNYEMRVLNVSGIVRPQDIAGNNTISYDKIAEARISYGGRGRISEVQQPPYGQQLMNKISPF
ncbi:flagellar basal body L-ring protein FlgH [Bartonella sp. TP]|uniref:flagellar basal body L-ring protein FlgH n=1 Tax=Bartonella sp. TP TaxID=3057550 RepID=UPI0025B014E0|nr:flagellar basal body L-ring protein FlgH [Bartonella sp. TP]MDN5249052.1 flagellar basal body L-ring protein FlgH [Alphaproteobacteria bacterium]WJW80271.1 flagellar basal body L-ring protein FlgH [Bartonella sp. TP]